MEYLEINLIEKYKKDKQLEKEIKNYQKKLSKKHNKFILGQKISFISGYNYDIKYTAKIIGFGIDNPNEIYVYWDCYWSPIRDELKRDIQIIED